MIELTFNTMFMLYLGGTLAIILGIWLYSHYRMRRRIFFPIEQDLFICEYCHFAYIEESVKHLNRCPQCGLYNKHNTYQSINGNKSKKS
jgi:hypothetical protein